MAHTKNFVEKTNLKDIIILVKKLHGCFGVE